MAWWIPAAIAATQAGIQMIPTAEEIANNKAIRELESRRKAGKLGLEDAERAALWSETHGAANARIQESRMRSEALQAAAGQTSGGASQAMAQGQMAAAGKAASQAAETIGKLDVQEREAERQELADRIAFKGSRQQERKNAVVGAATNFAKMQGMYEGTTGDSLFDEKAPSLFDGWTKTGGLTNDQATAVKSAQRLFNSGMRREAQDILMAYGLWPPPE